MTRAETGTLERGMTPIVRETRMPQGKSMELMILMGLMIMSSFQTCPLFSQQRQRSRCGLSGQLMFLLQLRNLVLLILAIPRALAIIHGI